VSYMCTFLALQGKGTLNGSELACKLAHMPHRELPAPLPIATAGAFFPCPLPLLMSPLSLSLFSSGFPNEEAADCSSELMEASRLNELLVVGISVGCGGVQDGLAGGYNANNKHSKRGCIVQVSQRFP